MTTDFYRTINTFRRATNCQTARRNVKHEHINGQTPFRFYVLLVVSWLFLTETRFCFAQAVGKSIQPHGFLAALNLDVGNDRDSNLSQPIGSDGQQLSKLSATVTPKGDAVLEPTIDPNEMVLRSVQQSVWGPGFASNFRQRTTLFGSDQWVSVVGHYAQAGLGTGQMKLEAKFATGETVNNFVQVSDGRLLWSSYAADEPLRYVNLDSVRQALTPLYNQPANQAQLALYLAIGGQAEVLRSLYLRYQWFHVQAGSIGEKPVWQLTGKIRTQSPAIVSEAIIDFASLRSDPALLVPTVVRLTLSRSTDFPLFPIKIEYFRRDAKKVKNKESLGPAELISTIDYYDASKLNEIPANYFQFQVQNDMGKTQETHLYLPPAKLFPPSSQK